MLNLKLPAIMGILNLTPDSFYDGGHYLSLDSQLKRVEQMLDEGAAIIDLGAVSTRPGAIEICQTGELERLLPAIKAIRHHFPGILLSVDTYRPLIARAMVEHGADMINDIYGGRFDPGMLETVAALKVPYILMHMKGTPGNMQQNPEYSDVVAEVSYFFEQQTSMARNSGILEIIIDPGFGFGKTLEHNFSLLSRLDSFKTLGYPLAVGLSRKSMITRALNIKPAAALNGSTVLHTISLLKGADILRVHDVKEAMEAVSLVNYLTFAEC
jgi:dihydropteroate synthase